MNLKGNKVKVNLQLEEHGLTYSVTGTVGDDWTTYNDVAELMSSVLSAAFGYKIYLTAETTDPDEVKAGLNDDGQDEDFIKP
jgi:hypothetical protein